MCVCDLISWPPFLLTASPPSFLQPAIQPRRDFEAQQAKASKSSPSSSKASAPPKAVVARQRPARKAAIEGKNMTSALAATVKKDVLEEPKKGKKKEKAVIKERSSRTAKRSKGKRAKSRRATGNKSTVKSMIEMGLLAAGMDTVEMHYKWVERMSTMKGRPLVRLSSYRARERDRALLARLVSALLCSVLPCSSLVKL